jgi:hypothetical protein
VFFTAKSWHASIFLKAGVGIGAASAFFFLSAGAVKKNTATKPVPGS